MRLTDIYKTLLEKRVINSGSTGQGGGVSYLNVDDITKIENGKSIFSKIYKERKKGDVFRGVEGGNLIPDHVFFVSENPLVARDYTRAENTSGKFGRVNDNYGKDAKFQRYSISKDAKILDAKTIEGVNELREILGLKPTNKFDHGAFKVYHLLDGISKEDAQKIKDAGYDAVRLYESDRDTGMSSVDGDSIAILNNSILKENPFKAAERSIKETPQAGSVINELAENGVGSIKKKQLKIINKTNPAPNNYNTWVRDIEDILSPEEAFKDDDNFIGTPDFRKKDAKEALENGEIIVYSSYPIKNGVFVTPSKMEATLYAGNKTPYYKKVKVTDVAWIDSNQGQYAKV